MDSMASITRDSRRVLPGLSACQEARDGGAGVASLAVAIREACVSTSQATLSTGGNPALEMAPFSGAVISPTEGTASSGRRSGVAGAQPAGLGVLVATLARVAMGVAIVRLSSNGTTTASTPTYRKPYERISISQMGIRNRQRTCRALNRRSAQRW